jgi:hypothetical protein
MSLLCGKKTLALYLTHQSHIERKQAELQAQLNPEGLIAAQEILA